MYEYYRECFFDYIIGESVDDYLCEAETTIGNENMINTMRSFKREWKPALNKYKRALKEGDMARAERYYKDCRRLLTDFGSILDELDYELTNSDALIGTLNSMLKNIAYGIYGALMIGNTAQRSKSYKVRNSGTKLAAVGAGAIVGAKTISDIHAIATTTKIKKDSGGKLTLQDFNIQRAKLVREFQKIVKGFEKIAKMHSKMLKASESSQPKNTEKPNESEDKES